MVQIKKVSDGGKGGDGDQLSMNFYLGTQLVLLGIGAQNV